MKKVYIEAKNDINQICICIELCMRYDSTLDSHFLYRNVMLNLILILLYSKDIVITSKICDL